MPVVLALARHTDLKASRLLIPLSFFAILAGHAGNTIHEQVGRGADGGCASQSYSLDHGEPAHSLFLAFRDQALT
jgi:hypothetical protein